MAGWEAHPLMWEASHHLTHPLMCLPLARGVGSTRREARHVEARQGPTPPTHQLVGADLTWEVRWALHPA